MINSNTYGVAWLRRFPRQFAQITSSKVSIVTFILRLCYALAVALVMRTNKLRCKWPLSIWLIHRLTTDGLSSVNQFEHVVEDEIAAGAVGKELEDLGIVHGPLFFVNLRRCQSNAFTPERALGS